MSGHTDGNGMVSVIIPAHNEEKVIGACLRALVKDAPPGAMEVIVACNGCTDRTAAIAREFGPPVRVLETPTPGKTNALNMGDAAATSFPRVYADADVELSWQTVANLAEAVRRGPALAAAPRCEYDLRGRPWLVRAYYKVWTSLPYFDDGRLGGVYVVSREGRSRWGEFPKIIADDLYAYLHFAPHEKTNIQDMIYLSAPRTLGGVARIFTRSRAGRYELGRLAPDLVSRQGIRWKKSAQRVLSRPSLWPCVPVYVGMVVWTRLTGYVRVLRKQPSHWTPEESSRELASARASS